MPFVKDMVNQLIGRANRNGEVYFNTENILASLAYLALGWIVASVIGSSIVKSKTGQVRFTTYLPSPIKAVKYLVSADGQTEFFTSVRVVENAGGVA